MVFHAGCRVKTQRFGPCKMGGLQNPTQILIVGWAEGEEGIAFNQYTVDEIFHKSITQYTILNLGPILPPGSSIPVYSGGTGIVYKIDLVPYVGGDGVVHKDIIGKDTKLYISLKTNKKFHASDANLLSDSALITMNPVNINNILPAHLYKSIRIAYVL